MQATFRVWMVQYSYALFACVTCVAGCVGMHGATPEITCRLVGAGVEEQTLRALYDQHGRLVVVGRDVFSCPCGAHRAAGAVEGHGLHGAVEDHKLSGAVEDHRLSGAVEDHRLSGAVEDHTLSGAVENHKLSGAVEDHRLSGAVEDHKLSGAMENHALSGAVEDHRLSGTTEVLTCTETSRCPGYLVSGRGALRVFDGAGLRTLASHCVP